MQAAVTPEGWFGIVVQYAYYIVAQVMEAWLEEKRGPPQSLEKKI